MSNTISLLYFTSNKCSICISLLPKLEALIKTKFPSTHFQVYSIEEYPKIAANYSIFTAPVLLLEINSKEWKRWVRTFGLAEVEDYLNRIQTLSN